MDTKSDVTKGAPTHDAIGSGKQLDYILTSGFTGEYPIGQSTQRTNISFHYVRYLIIIIGGLVNGFMMMTRTTVSFALLGMVNHTHLYLEEHPNSTADEFFEPGYIEVGEFNWNNEIQQIIISGYMVSYTLPQVFTTRLSLKYGMRISATICSLVCGISSCLIPIVTYWGWEWLLAMRLLNGMGGSALIPIMIGAIGSWFPNDDSALGFSLLQFVQVVFTIITPLFSGELTSVHWKWAFYIPGLFNVMIGLVWYIIASETPDSCSFVSQQELDFIEGGKQGPKESKVDSKLALALEEEKKKPSGNDFRWYFMFKFPSFYCLCIIWVMFECSCSGLAYLLPSYFKRILEISTLENGACNFIIQSGFILSMLWPNPVIAFLRNQCSMSLTNARRVVIFICAFLAVTTAAYIAAYHTEQIALLTINRFAFMTIDTVVTVTLMGQFGCGASSLAYGMMNTIGCLSITFFCWAIGRFLDYTGESKECWSWIYVLISVMSAAIFLLYAIFIKSEPLMLETSNQKENNKAKAVDCCV